MSDAVVYLIGGAPGAGKTTLGRALGTRVGSPSLTGDDILTAVRGVTTRDSHPDLHRIGAGGHLDYFTNSTVERLKTDTVTQHNAVWPALERVALKRVQFDQATVIDYWGLLPNRVASLNEPHLLSMWIHIDEDVLIAREKANSDFFDGSADPERMFAKFMARSLWWNERIRAEATELKLLVLLQDGTKSPDDLIEEFMSAGSAPSDA